MNTIVKGMDGEDKSDVIEGDHVFDAQNNLFRRTGTQRREAAPRTSEAQAMYIS